ncbi:hypothetical protein KC19_VG163400 [Ceratodon purpureus]|uniref:Uncharacterized protein n=1 Tax=Ceratodon purpureus TaxID=3225 RepID=A0A8T0HR42_CERPU|nr:hypothetical protein KC19_VG163400 [Ceratodon purpureus]
MQLHIIHLLMASTSCYKVQEAASKSDIHCKLISAIPALSVGLTQFVFIMLRHAHVFILSILIMRCKGLIHCIKQLGLILNAIQRLYIGNHHSVNVVHANIANVPRNPCVNGVYLFEVEEFVMFIESTTRTCSQGVHLCLQGVHF